MDAVCSGHSALRSVLRSVRRSGHSVLRSVLRQRGLKAAAAALDATATTTDAAATAAAAAAVDAGLAALAGHLRTDANQPQQKKKRTGGALGGR